MHRVDRRLNLVWTRTIAPEARTNERLPLGDEVAVPQRALLIDTMKTHGVDSFPALVAATVQGSTETTFNVLAVYFGAVGIQRARHAVACALLADLAGVIASVSVCYWFFG